MLKFKVSVHDDIPIACHIPLSDAFAYSIRKGAG